jgi:hypothetical protein
MTEAHFDYYRIGMRRLLEALGPNHPSYSDALVLQLRLEENLNNTERFGPSPSLQSERAQILDSCNRVSLSATGSSFFYLCGLPEPASAPRERADSLFREAAHQQIEGDLGYALQLFRQVKELDPNYPRIDVTIAAVEREIGAPYVDRYGRVRERGVLGVPSPAPARPIQAARAGRRYWIAFVAGLILVIIVVIVFILLYR